MDQTLEALGGLFLKALPTFLLVLLLHFYLKRMFFGPLSKALKARDDATAGARRVAEAALAKAEQRAAEYEAALRAARGEVHQQQEALRKQWRDEQTAAIAAARRGAEATLKEAKTRIAAEAEAARLTLAAQSESLAGEIARVVCERGAR